MLIDRAEVVRADWDGVMPPTTGWEQVKLIDFWDARWPKHDGVVWYRLRWQQTDTKAPVGLLLNYVCLANAVYVNGSLVARDPQLVEPLSRSWVKPQYFLLDSPLLHPGENTLLVRVSGLSKYQPGFGTVTVGDPAVVRVLYERGLFERFHIRIINFAMTGVLGSIFLLLWLLRRRDSTYGWFALSQLLGSFWSYNYIASSPWPFSSTDAWQAFIAAMYMATCSSYTIFLFRFGDRCFPRLEAAMGIACVAALAAALLAPEWMGPHRTPWTLLAAAFYYAGIIWFLLRAIRVPHADIRVLAVCLLVPVIASMHDFAMFLGWVRSDTNLMSLTSVLTLLGISFALAYRFVGAMRKVETFNVELKREVETATRELGDTLQREHELALAHSRSGERLQLVRDLHDGFGGTLVGAIARLEQAPEDMPKQKVVAVLKDMRDDLRLVIDSTAREHARLGELLVPLRHRATTLFEAAGIDSHWQLSGIDEIELGSARSLDLLRLLQEALTNVFKHSQATRVEVSIERHDQQLNVRVQDNGRGLPDESSRSVSGAGFSSMRQRALRMGGELKFSPASDGTALFLNFAL